MSDEPPPHLVSAAHDLLGTLDAAHIPACLIGGMAVSRWGQPRATADADFSALAPYSAETAVLDVLLARFRPRRSDARDFALQHRVLLLVSDKGVGLDVARPFEAAWRLVQRD